MKERVNEGKKKASAYVRERARREREKESTAGVRTERVNKGGLS